MPILEEESSHPRIAVAGADPVGSLAWLRRTDGRLSFADRLRVLAAAFGGLREGFALARRAKAGGRRDLSLELLAPPDTTMVRAARAHLAARSTPAMANHCYRTGFFTLAVLHQNTDVTPRDTETAWVAALLHDVGLDDPPARGDFSLGGVRVVESLALEHGWDDEQTYLASEAIATNLSTRVDRKRSGTIAWAMNVGGLGELGFGPHRAQLHPDRLAELEALYPRDDFRKVSRALLRAEARRVPGGRFAFLGWVFPLIMVPGT